MRRDDVIDDQESWQRDYNKCNWKNFESEDVKKISFKYFVTTSEFLVYDYENILFVNLFINKTILFLCVR